MKQTIGNYNVRKIDWVETNNGVINVEHLMVYTISNLSDTIKFSLIIKPEGKVMIDVEDAPQSFVNKSLDDLQEFIVGEYKNSLVEQN
jgi:hypothetical protein